MGRAVGGATALTMLYHPIWRALREAEIQVSDVVNRALSFLSHLLWSSSVAHVGSDC